jgi:hypothetical protein
MYNTSHVVVFLLGRSNHATARKGDAMTINKKTQTLRECTVTGQWEFNNRHLENLLDESQVIDAPYFYLNGARFIVIFDELWTD